MLYITLFLPALTQIQWRIQVYNGGLGAQ